MQSDSVSAHEKRPAGSNSRWGLPKNRSTKVHRPQLSKRNMKAASGSDLISVMLPERKTTCKTFLPSKCFSAFFIRTFLLSDNRVTHPSPPKVTSEKPKLLTWVLRGSQVIESSNVHVCPLVFQSHMCRESLGFKIERTSLGARLRVRRGRNFPTHWAGFLALLFRHQHKQPLNSSVDDQYCCCTDGQHLVFLKECTRMHEQSQNGI